MTDVQTHLSFKGTHSGGVLFPKSRTEDMTAAAPQVPAAQVTRG